MKSLGLLADAESLVLGLAPVNVLDFCPESKIDACEVFVIRFNQYDL